MEKNYLAIWMWLGYRLLGCVSTSWKGKLLTSGCRPRLKKGACLSSLFSSQNPLFFWSAPRTRTLATTKNMRSRNNGINFWECEEEPEVRDSRTSVFGSGQSPCSWRWPKERQTLGKRMDGGCIKVRFDQWQRLFPRTTQKKKYIFAAREIKWELETPTSSNRKRFTDVW